MSADDAGSIVFAGGGTGGHISPGIAIAEEVAALAPRFRRVFACSTRAVDARMLAHVGADFVPISAEGFSLEPRRLLRFLRAYAAGRREARELLAARRARLVVSLGGFVTAPVAAAARSLGVPLLLVNLDATPGKANRMVARHAARTLSACATPSMPRFAERIVGMPIRSVARAALPPGESRRRFGLEPGMRTLLVTGASQGAASLNELVLMLLRQERPAFGGWQALHLVGQADPAPIEEAYRAAGVRAAVLPFVHEMGLAWGAADLALSRAGANSVAEAVVNDVPTVFAPYPYHKDLHQRHNAEPYARDGVAVLADDLIEPARNMATLGAALLELMTVDPRREAMRAALQARPREAAARTVAEVAVAMAAESTARA